VNAAQSWWWWGGVASSAVSTITIATAIAAAIAAAIVARTIAIAGAYRDQLHGGGTQARCQARPRACARRWGRESN